MSKKEATQRFTIVCANLKCLDSRKTVLLVLIIAIAAVMSSRLCDLRTSSRICKTSARTNRAGSLNGVGMAKSRATSLEAGTGTPWMERSNSLRGSVSFLVEWQENR